METTALPENIVKIHTNSVAPKRISAAARLYGLRTVEETPILSH